MRKTGRERVGRRKQTCRESKTEGKPRILTKIDPEAETVKKRLRKKKAKREIESGETKTDSEARERATKTDGIQKEREQRRRG